MTKADIVNEITKNTGSGKINSLTTVKTLHGHSKSIFIKR